MQFTFKTSKNWLILSICLFAFNPSVFSQGKGVWKGANDTFSKASYATWTSAQNQDRITDSVWITRKDDQGIFNIKVSGAYTTNTSPRRTLWSFGNTSNLSSLSFRNWESAVSSNPPSMVNKDMVMLIVKDSIYIDIKFKSWASGGSGGGFSYIRSTDCRSFSDVKTAICDSFVSPSKRHVWRTSGIYFDTLSNSTSCDSIITFDLTIYGRDTGTLFTSGCGFVILPLSKRKVTATGTYYDTLVNGTICGRDSILVAKVFIYTVPTKSLTVASCDSFISPSGRYVWDSTGTYTDILTAVGTCDTAVTVNLTINSSEITNLSAVTCDSFISVTNQIYRQTGNYFDTLQTVNGCDSVIALDLTINNSSLTKISPTVCKVSYQSPSGKYVWGVSGKYYDTLMSAALCDSVLEINLTVNPYESSDVVQSCDPWVSPSGKYVYDMSGIYVDTLIAGDKCDSLVTINFTKLEHTTGTLNVLAAINRYHSPSGRYLWTTTGMYNDTIPNMAGCDSVITFDLTIANFSLDVTQNGNDLTAVATGVNYQWLDCDDSFKPVSGETSQTFSVKKKGKYAVELSNQWNADTSDCIEMNLGLEKDLNPYGIQIYPNPNSGHFTVNLGQVFDQVQFLQVFNSKGKMISENPVNRQFMELDVEHQATGIYLVRVIGQGFSHNTWVVVR